MYQSLSPIIWVIISLGVLFLLERWIHRHMQGIAYLITGSLQWSVLLYALILFPGVFLHELSHWIMANLLGMRTGRFSVWPSLQPDGTIRLGYVEFYKTQRVAPVRESLIGGAPLIFGIGAILLIGHYVFNANILAQTVATGTPQAIGAALSGVFSTADAWIWLYLLFSISNAMMPSPSDRKAWPLFGVILAILLIILYFAGFRDEMWQALIGPITNFAGYLLLAFAITIVVDLFFVVVILIFEFIVTKLFGKRIDYSV
ncbi:MAG: hypothetical protein AB8G95_01440 [Anaerolineae bacterium]